MASIGVHRFADLERFRWQWDDKLESNARRRTMLADGSGSPRECLRLIVQDSLKLAGIALVLNKGDAAAREQFESAAGAAREFLTPRRVSDANPRVVDVETSIDDKGRMASAAIRERPTPVPPAGWRGWDVGEFGAVIETLMAFGQANDARDAAAIPESAYRSPEVVAEEAMFFEVRAKKSWLVSDDAAAMAASRAAIKSAKEKILRTGAAGIMALIERDERGFRAALADTVAAHKAIYSRMPKKAEGVFSLAALPLARMARTYGIDVPEGPYLPVQFLAAGALR